MEPAQRAVVYAELTEQPWVVAYSGYALLYAASKLPKDAILRKDMNGAPYIIVDAAHRFVKTPTVDVFAADDLQRAYAVMDLVARRHQSEFPRRGHPPEPKRVSRGMIEHIHALLRYRRAHPRN